MSRAGDIGFIRQWPPVDSNPAGPSIAYRCRNTSEPLENPKRCRPEVDAGIDPVACAFRCRRCALRNRHSGRRLRQFCAGRVGYADSHRDVDANCDANTKPYGHTHNYSDAHQNVDAHDYAYPYAKPHAHVDSDDYADALARGTLLAGQTYQSPVSGLH